MVRMLTHGRYLLDTCTCIALIKDMFIAATAIEEDLIVVTGNTEHFSRIPGLKVENWMQ